MVMANPSTRQSSGRSTKSGDCPVPREATSIRLSSRATQRPETTPMVERRTLSVSNWRTTCHREAPVARRTPISRWRALARASMRFARLTHDASSTTPDNAKRSHSGVP